MHGLQKEGNRKAEIVNKIRDKREEFVGTLLLGNNLANILASSIATSVMIAHFGEWGVFIATGVMTILILIFAEVLPKTYALYHADRMALIVSPIVKVMITLFSPATNMVAVIVRKTLLSFGVRMDDDSVGDIAELRGAIEMHHGSGQGSLNRRAMLRSVLDLAEVDLRSILIHRRNVGMVDGDSAMSDIVQAVLDSAYSRMPVYKQTPDNVIGIIHAKWLLKEIQQTQGNLNQIKLEDIMSDPWFVPESTTLFDQLQAFRARREHFALVVDEYGALLGVVTLEDILEEIVGEIDDEHDSVVAGVRKDHSGTFIVNGSVTIRDLNREFDWSLPDDEDYATIAGLVLYEARRLPLVGHKFIFHDFLFEILKRQRHQITQVRITPPNPTAFSTSGIKPSDTKDLGPVFARANC